MKLSHLIRQDRFESPAQEAILNVVVTNSWLLGRMSSIMSDYGVTVAQYNVLRILRGSHPRHLTCSEIRERLLDRTPDVTRLLDRLVRDGLAVRERSEHDRRVVLVGITQKGVDLLDRMIDVVQDLERALTRHLSDGELSELSALLEKLRTDQQP